MVSTSSLLPKLARDFPDITFLPSVEGFSWSPEERTVFYMETNDTALLLHELSHGLLSHQDYRRDVELIAMETAAWEEARRISARYGVTIDDDVADQHLETYRQWMHDRSTCPECEASGVQTGRQAYHCIACGARWKVNEARLCALRRHVLTH
jgi:hypothetical protein